MIVINKSSLKFIDIFNSLLDKYNSGAHDVDKLFEDLIKLANDLYEEDQRAVKENLSKNELAIFDLLLKK